MADKKRMELFAVREIPEEQQIEGGRKAWWTKVGVAFENRDGSWSINLDALPIDGKLQMRVPLPPKEVEFPPKDEPAARTRPTTTKRR